MIDPATLPIVKDGETLVEGQRFIIKGENFDKWPEELVLSYQENIALGTPMPEFRLMKLVGKTNEELVFECTVTHKYQFLTQRIFNIFATPFGVPREILGYHSIDTMG